MTSKTTRSTQRPLGVGLIGAGMIGAHRARALHKVESGRLVAVADLDADRRRQALAGHPDAAEYADMTELLEDPAVEAVILSTPPSSHEALGLRVIAAGKALLCEKPLAVSEAACRRLVEAAEASGVPLATGFNLRYSRAARLARRLLDAGAIGELDHIRSFHGHAGGDEFTHDWIHDAAQTGGGTLMDNGIHLIDLTRSFLGEVAEVQGFASHHTWRFEGCEDNGFLLLRSEAGRVATLQASWTEWRGYGYRVEIYGTEGFLRFGYPPLYLIHGHRRPGGGVSTRRHLFPLYQLQERLRGWQWALEETLVREMDAWLGALGRGDAPPVDGRDGWEAVRLAHSAYGRRPDDPGGGPAG